MWYGHGFGWGGMIFGGVMMLIFWGSLIALIFWGVRSLISHNDVRQSRTGMAPLSAREILDQRYARGEITRDEYESMKVDLAS